MTFARRPGPLGRFNRRGLGSGGDWRPTLLSGCVLWLRDSVTESGGAVSSWNDLSGGAHHAVQATAGNKPTYGATGLNSRPAITFDGAASPNHDLLVTDNVDLSAATGVTWFLVLKDTATAASVLFEKGASLSGGNPGIGCYVNEVAGTVSMVWKGGTSAVRDYRTTAAETLATARILSMRVDATQAAASEYGMWIDGTAQTLAQVGSSDGVETAGGFGNNAFNIGSRTGGVAPWAGTIAEIIVYNSALSTADRDAVESYLGKRYSITVA